MTSGKEHEKEECANEEDEDVEVPGERKGAFNIESEIRPEAWAKEHSRIFDRKAPDDGHVTISKRWIAGGHA